VLNQRIHAIWSRELALEDFSDTDDFFAIGGHSLIMARIQEAIGSELGLDVPMDQLFRKSTVADISAYLESTAAVA
jgi:acyl carrier protein